MRIAWTGLWLFACGQRAADADVRAAAVPEPGTAEPVSAAPETAAPADVVHHDSPPPEPTSTSTGSPNDGRLEGGVALPEAGPGFLHNPRRTNAEARWGTVEMVGGIVRAAETVERELPGSMLVVNDVGLPGGGPIPHHGSHRSGRDVDILFYLTDPDGNPIPSVGVPLDPRGRGWDFKDLTERADDVRVRIDLPRTWRFLQALAEDEAAGLQRVFVAEHLRTLLLEHAARVRAPRTAIERVGDAACQPEMPHDDHLHVRFFCTAQDVRAGCQDSYPIYTWRRRALTAEGVEAVQATRTRRDRPASKTVSRAQARAKAGRMHWLVKQTLDARETWSAQPHPGRRWCP